MKNSTNIWQEADINDLAKALTITYKGQNTYKEPLEIQDRLDFWKFVLESKYTVKQVLHGLKIFLERDKNMPVPADINNILDPPPVLISDAEYVAAQKWQERNNFPMMSDAKDTIEDYLAQGQESRDAHHRTSQEVNEIGSSQLGRITNA